MIGLIWKDIATLDEVNFDARDFLTVEGRFYYSVAKELRNNAHLNQLDEVAVASNLSEDILKRFDVQRVVYGHLHGAGLAGAMRGDIDGITYHQVSCDGLDFKLEFILK